MRWRSSGHGSLHNHIHSFIHPFSVHSFIQNPWEAHSSVTHWAELRVRAVTSAGLIQPPRPSLRKVPMRTDDKQPPESGDRGRTCASPLGRTRSLLWWWPALGLTAHPEGELLRVFQAGWVRQQGPRGLKAKVEWGEFGGRASIGNEAQAALSSPAPRPRSWASHCRVPLEPVPTAIPGPGRSRLCSVLCPGPQNVVGAQELTRGYE